MTATPVWIHAFLDVPCAQWPGSVAFWSSVTGWAASELRGEAQQFVTLRPAAGDAWLKLQAIDGPMRIHLNLGSADRPSAVERSVELGALPVGGYNEVAVMRSPGGLLFCHTIEEHSRRFARIDAESVLDQVCVDIPAPLWDEEVAFWTALTGRELEHGMRTEFAFLGDPDPSGGLRILLQRLDSGHGQVRAHLDFAVADRAAQTGRHAAQGSQVIQVMDRWTVMRAPDGQLYCLTDRDPLSGRVRR